MMGGREGWGREIELTRERESRRERGRYTALWSKRTVIERESERMSERKDRAIM